MSAAESWELLIVSASIGRAIGIFLLASTSLGLTACEATYNDTRGWANRLEASLLEAAENAFDGIDGDASHEGDVRPDSGLEWEEADSIPNSAPQSGADSGLVQQTAARMVAPASDTPEAMKAPESMPVAAEAGEPKVRNAAASDPTGPSADRPPATNGTAPAGSAGKEIDPTGPARTAAADGTQALPKLKPTREPQPKAGDKAKAARPGKPDGSAMVIHLSSLRSEAAAKKEWQALKKAFPDQLSAMTPSFRRTEIANRGVFYRVLVGPLPSKKSARAVCGALKAKKQYCQVMPAPPAA